MKTIYVGLSGGVDSATSAALLQKQGFEVVGVFIKIWSPEFLECTWERDRLDAMRVAVHLGIAFKEIDLSAEYMEGVVRSMIHDYEQGITPNPDVLCNEKIKFGAFATWAFENGADYVATGHYARVREVNACFELLRGVDASKDQSYFLYRLTQEQLSRTLFPIGGYQKSDVRKMAEEFGLPVATRKDSQGLCFVGDVTMKDFLSRFISIIPGEVFDESGVVGEHEGAALYTIGQRHGFRYISTAAQRGPFFATRIDIKNNIVYVSADRSCVLKKSCLLTDMHWIAGAPPLPYSAHADVRYHARPAAVEISSAGEKYTAAFTDAQLLTPGQSVVIYNGDRCLGGGIVSAA